jgi:Inositol phospholipid synthesis and fat-storage-inducing TM
MQSPDAEHPATEAKVVKEGKPDGAAISNAPANASLFVANLVTIELVLLAVYPVTVILGMISNHPRESYFALKNNFINVYFLKFAWAWTTIAFIPHLIQLPRKAAPLARYAVATIWWFLVTQWCFGPPIMDKAIAF